MLAPLACSAALIRSLAHSGTHGKVIHFCELNASILCSFNNCFFLDAFLHLQKRSIRLSVGPFVGASVSRSVELKPCKGAVFDQNYNQYERERFLCRVSGLVTGTVDKPIETDLSWGLMDAHEELSRNS